MYRNRPRLSRHRIRKKDSRRRWNDCCSGPLPKKLDGQRGRNCLLSWPFLSCVASECRSGPWNGRKVKQIGHGAPVRLTGQVTGRGKVIHPSTSSSPTCDFRFVANGREKIPTIRACVAGGGWRGGFRYGLVRREFRSCCGGNFSNDDGGDRSFGGIKYWRGIFHSGPRYFTVSVVVEIGNRFRAVATFYPSCLQQVALQIMTIKFDALFLDDIL
jgi:hypothetical protein